ncbi:hypothetical protein GCM10017783_22760 [Deinococcus piscis]|uniref:DEAD/DEAH box helicase n=1 Tax=Deinococcus piscis TaxID=394230 RepID=A0ABQ3K9Q5_9DEIO|nr:DEAD/DEAH box helicase [Deinococcus piscis]GHG09711.1 hypothetical protein GCM10017783_22760 [Deinococcus piscis]
MQMNDPLAIQSRLERIYRLYVESAFPLKYEGLAAERRQLLQEVGTLAQPALIEPVPTYPSSGLTLEAAAKSLGTEYRDLAPLAGPLFPAGRTLYQHQWQALQGSLEGQDVVVTTGTGSGKTESFMLPLLAALAAESRKWPAPQPQPEEHSWWQGKGERLAQWGHSTRPHAIRGLILYPLNALVEDQLRRLRSVLDAPEVTAWMDRERKGNRFTFGRYTSLAPLAGPIDEKRTEKLREILREREAEWRRVSEKFRGHNGGHQYHFPNPESGELWSRWDAQETPPDLLITNYSMLNIMLMRALEQGMFEQTKQWLAADPSHVFHLVVDELHAYRGTPGTEVSYILRLLFERLGLKPDSPQLRILATSASLSGDENGKAFLSEFFGREARRFEVIGTPQVPPKRTPDLGEFAAAFAEFAEQNPAPDLDSGKTAIREDSKDQLGQRLGSPDLAQGLQDADIPEALRAACWDEKLGVRATSSINLAAKLFPQYADPDKALRGTLLALASTKHVQAVRAHLFFQNVQNLWVCVNAGCGRQSQEGEAEAQVGRIHSTHRLTCDCGSRVLDLLVCEVCGEVFLGAHRKSTHDKEKILSADRSDLEGIPDQMDNRTYGRYAVLWPVENHDITPANPDYDWNRRERRWQSHYLEKATGLIVPRLPKGESPNQFQPVWLYSIVSRQAADADYESAFPPICPACDSDYRRREILPTPIRHHRTGFQKAAQVLASTLMREVSPEERKLVVFSDSRQDAARLAAGMERDHFRDMVRVALLGTLQEYSADLEAAVRFNFQSVTQSNPIALEKLQAINPALAVAAQKTILPTDAQQAAQFMLRPNASSLLAFLLHAPLPEVAQQEITELLTQYPSRIPIAQLRDAVFGKLLEQGICPGGNTLAALHYKEGNSERPWHEAFLWRPDGVKAKTTQPEAKAHAEHLSALLLVEIMMVLFTHQVRTLESIGQGRVIAPIPNASVDIQEAADALVRFLAVKRRYANSEFVEVGSQNYLPAPAKKYLAQINQDEEQMRERLLTHNLAEKSGNGLIVSADHLVLAAHDPQGGGFRCQKCRAYYLHRAGGVCIHCGGQVLPDPQGKWDDDYYTYLARAESQSFRLNAEELTGQTDTLSRAQRQRHFQEVFLENENERAQGVDLLSVTTTMEAGVDIGSLSAVMMSNMPPRRFNYQQRVGRAGRRGHALSLAVTLCRGRTHDSYYYARPEAMTGDAPPPPYVDTASKTIFRRVLNKEVLRRAIGANSAVTTDSVHGEFGSVQEWIETRTDPNGKRANLQAFLADPQQWAEIRHLAAQLSTCTRLTTEDVHQALEDLRTLPQRIDEVADDKHLIQDHLSERLAHQGLLPMFGFPTRTRLLYLDKLTQIDGVNFPPKNVVDRDLDLAISAFAPGAEIVRDKRVHQAVGVVNLRPSGRGLAKAEPGFYPPLSEENPRPLGVCKHCRAIHEQEAFAGHIGEEMTCPTCGQEQLHVMDAREPRHFYASGEPKDYSGFFEIRGFTTRPTVAVLSGEQVAVTNALLTTAPNDAQNEVLTFNDYAGRGGFDFGAGPLQGAYSADLSAKPAAQREKGSKRIALLSRRRTDTLGIGVRQWPAHHAAPSDTVEGRAAWYSLAFALRDAAAVMLDIESGELDGGLYVGVENGQALASAFLSDRLENGAGYARHLGNEQVFGQLLAQLGGSLRQKWEAHAAECDASCAQCLRDYTNLAFHPILDWRLALDMGELLHHSAPLSLRGSHWENLYQGQESPIWNSLTQLQFEPLDTNSPLPIFVRNTKQGKKLTFLRHPLWTSEHPDIVTTHQIASEFGEVSEGVSPFMLLRRPSDAL